MLNIDYLSQGYNIFKGNPNSFETFDEGFSRNQIFQVSYDQAKVSGDGRYSIPDAMDIRQEQTCFLSFDSATITGETSLTNSLKQTVSTSFEGYGAAFKASATYSKMT